MFIKMIEMLLYLIIIGYVGIAGLALVDKLEEDFEANGEFTGYCLLFASEVSLVLLISRVIKGV